MEASELDALWDFDDPAGSEARFRGALASSPEPDDALVLRTQLARTLGLQKRFDEANAELDAVPAAAGSLVEVYTLLERGRVLRSSGSPATAVPLFEQALRAAQSAGLDALAADAAHMLAIATEGEEQIAWARRALEIADSSEDPRARRWTASITHNLGWTLHDLGRYDEAMEQWRRALALREERGEPEPLRIARWTVARGLRSLGRHEEALAIQLAILPEDPEDQYVHEELAALYTALGRHADAAHHQAQVTT
jgi:tetratricopeptide (TPR) repeat protein